jgi:predicted TIM-barrel fold metal-dependent hydrolase
MLHVPETRVPRARFPAIDSHTHLSTVVGRPMPSSDVPLKEGPEGPRASMSSSPAAVLAMMDRLNLRMMVNVTGGYGPALDETVNYWHKPHPDRFLVCTEPWWTRFPEPGYARMQGDEIHRAHRAGARGVKVMKTLGLYLREQLNSGPLVRVDDPRFDPMWEAAGGLGIPVLIHVSDPEAFFEPVDRYNERYQALQRRPEWSFHGRDFPAACELQEARNRVQQRHPRTQFVALHMGDPENLGFIAESMDRYPNMWVEISARVDELGRQPRVARKFFDRYQDRILFGSDAIMDTPEKVGRQDRWYEAHVRFLETEDDYFESGNAPWRIYGIGLPDSILRKVYSENAARLFGLRA